MKQNCDYSIDKNNCDYDFYLNRAAVSSCLNAKKCGDFNAVHLKISHCLCIIICKMGVLKVVRIAFFLHVYTT